MNEETPSWLEEVARMPSTDGLITHEVSDVSSGNSHAGQAYVGRVSPPTITGGADPFSAAFTAMSTHFATEEAVVHPQLEAATVALIGKNTNSTGILLGTDGANGGMMDGTAEV